MIVVEPNDSGAGDGTRIAQGGHEMTDEQWLRLELKNAQARRHRLGRGVAARVARVLHRLVRHPG
jgi:hypothetical protein